MTDNWIDGPNPFGLVKPPQFFLTDMATFDADLVMFPSTEQPCYRLCRKVRRGAPITQVGTMINQLGAREPRFDHKILVKARLVPVVSLRPHPMWGPKILKDLALADLWRHGGADAASETIEAREAEIDAKLNIAIDDEAVARGHSAWSAYKWNSGQRIDLGARQIPKKRPSTSRPSNGPTDRPLRGDSSSVIFSGDSP